MNKKGSSSKDRESKVSNANGKNGRKDVAKYADQMLKAISQRPADVDSLSREIDISEQMVFRAAQELVNRGYRIIKNVNGQFSIEKVSQGAPLSLSEHQWRPTTRAIFWSGSELGSIGQQGDLLKTVYKTIISEEKPDFIVALGNVVVGNLSRARLNETFLTEDPDFYKGATKRTKLVELLHRAQVNYALKAGSDIMVSSSHKCKTHFISGLRERSFIHQGLDDPLKVICASKKEKDWVYVGRNMHMFRVTNTGDPLCILALTSKKSPFRGVYTRGYRPRKTGTAIAGWLINRLRVRGVKDFPHVIIWTDGVGMYTSMFDSGGSVLASLPKLSVTDPTELELDTPPNIGVVVLDITFNMDGTLKKHGIQVGFRNLAPYVRERGY